MTDTSYLERSYQELIDPERWGGFDITNEADMRAAAVEPVYLPAPEYRQSKKSFEASLGKFARRGAEPYGQFVPGSSYDTGLNDQLVVLEVETITRRLETHCQPTGSAQLAIETTPSVPTQSAPYSRYWLDNQRGLRASPDFGCDRIDVHSLGVQATRGLYWGVLHTVDDQRYIQPFSFASTLLIRNMLGMTKVVSPGRLPRLQAIPLPVRVGEVKARLRASTGRQPDVIAMDRVDSIEALRPYSSKKNDSKPPKPPRDKDGRTVGVRRLLPRVGPQRHVLPATS